MSDTPSVEEIWHRIGGRERARVTRVWESNTFCGGGRFVRCQSLHGGKAWFAHVEDFILRFEPEKVALNGHVAVTDPADEAKT